MAAIEEFVSYVAESEPGSIMYAAWQELDEPTKFVHLFTFQDDEAHRIHGSSEAIRRFESAYQPAVGGWSGRLHRLPNRCLQHKLLNHRDPMSHPSRSATRGCMTAPPIAAVNIAAGTRASDRALSHEKPVQTIHHVPELFVVREKSDDHRIAEERALHSTAFDRQIDDAFDQHLARRGRLLSASASSIAVSTLASSASAAARTISSLEGYWW